MEHETGSPVEVHCEQIWGQLHRELAASENQFLEEYEEDDGEEK